MQRESQNIVLSAQLKTSDTHARCTVISIKCKCWKTKRDLKPEKLNALHIYL